jgi:hypothetical protein
MGSIKTVISCEPYRLTKKKQTVYEVVLDDGSEGTSMTKFEVGDKAKYIFDERWGVPKVIPAN